LREATYSDGRAQKAIDLQIKGGMGSIVYSRNKFHTALGGVV